MDINMDKKNSVCELSNGKDFVGNWVCVYHILARSCVYILSVSWDIEDWVWTIN